MWTECQTVVFLHQQMWVTDVVYSAIMTRLRDGMITEEDITVLRSRLVHAQGVHLNTEYWTRALFITPINKTRMALNNMAMHYFAMKEGQCILVVQASDKLSCGTLVSESLQQKLLKMSESKTSFLASELSLFVGMPVMLKTNVAIELGLCNSTMGVVFGVLLTAEIRLALEQCGLCAGQVNGMEVF